MAMPSTATRTPVTRRVASGSTSPPANTVVSTVRGGTTARSAVPSRVTGGPLSSSTKRTPNRSSPTPSSSSTGDAYKATLESLEAALKKETEEKESLLLRIQAHEQTIATTSQENESLTSSLNSAENRLTELYAEQTRMEEEMAARLEVIDKLRQQVKELEKEKRDALRRYNEQTTSFEAERQAFYDSEQHLKSRIQSLSQARRKSVFEVPPPAMLEETASENLVAKEAAALTEAPSKPSQPENTAASEDTEPAEMTALRLELSTMSTSYTSVQNTLHLLQTQLNDLQRVNNELQDENESYNILLRERTMNGQFDIMRASANRGDDDSEQGDDGGESSPNEEGLKPSSEREGRPQPNRSRSTLDVVMENDEGPQNVAAATMARREESPSSRHSGSLKRSRRGGPRAGSPVGRGESLADLPVAGPGLDLAAELGRAENKDILEGRVEPSKASSQPTANAHVDNSEISALRNEVKALKDANKALSLYASKIIDRIISQEGFEHVLAVDYEANPKKLPSPKKPKAAPPKSRPLSFFGSSKPATVDLTSPAESKPDSSLMSRATSDTSGVRQLEAPTMEQSKTAPVTSTASADASLPGSAAEKRARRGLSVDWKGITSLFGGGSGNLPPPEPKNDKIRPLTLRPGMTTGGLQRSNSTSATYNARKVETVEDENDRRERERMVATMKLMGIETPAPIMSPPSMTPSPGAQSFVPPPTPPLSKDVTSPPPSRASLFTRFRADPSAQPSPPLTAEALEQAEAASTIATLDAREKALAAEYAKGSGNGGFTELRKGTLSEGYRKKSSQRSGSAGGGGARARASLDVGDDVGSNHSRAGSVNTLFSAGTME